MNMAPAIGVNACFDLVRGAFAASTAAFLAAANLKYLSILWPFLLQKSQVSSLDCKDLVSFSCFGGLFSLFGGPDFPVMKVLWPQTKK